MQPLINRLRSFLERMLQGAFPDYAHAPSKSEEHSCMPSVAIDIPLEFMPPEVFVGLRGGCISAAFMSVPETAMNENHSLVLGEYKVGRAR